MSKQHVLRSVLAGKSNVPLLLVLHIVPFSLILLGAVKQNTEKHLRRVSTLAK